MYQHTAYLEYFISFLKDSMLTNQPILMNMLDHMVCTSCRAHKLLGSYNGHKSTYPPIIQLCCTFHQDSKTLLSALSGQLYSLCNIPQYTLTHTTLTDNRFITLTTLLGPKCSLHFFSSCSTFSSKSHKHFVIYFTHLYNKSHVIPCHPSPPLPPPRANPSPPVQHTPLLN